MAVTASGSRMSTMSASDAARSAAYYDDRAPRYDAEVTTAAGDRLARRAFLDLAMERIPGGATVLDFGSGTGLDAKTYADAGYQVLAWDNSPGMMAQLRERCAREVDAGTVAPGDPTLTFEQQLSQWRRPDAIVSNFAVLNMMEDVRPLFRLFAAALPAGAPLIVSLVNPLYWKHPFTARWWRNTGRRLRGASPHYLTRHFSSYLHPLNTIRTASPDFEWVGHASAGRVVRYQSSDGAPARFWNDTRPPGALGSLKQSLWHSAAAISLGTFVFVVFRRRA